MSKQVTKAEWKQRAEILADMVLWLIERGCAIHNDDTTPCRGCRADDVLKVMGRFEDLTKREVARAAKRLAQEHAR